jgi:preprotein translocase subunit YajC
MIAVLAQSSQSSPLSLLIFLVPLGLMFYFMRNQKRRMQAQQDLQRSAEVGDEILTTSGMFGRIIDEDVDEDTVLVEIAPGTRVKMLRAGISRRLTLDDEAGGLDSGNAEGPIGS